MDNKPPLDVDAAIAFNTTRLLELQERINRSSSEPHDLLEKFETLSAYGQRLYEYKKYGFWPERL